MYANIPLLKNKSMKKTFIIIFCLFLLAAGCGKKSDSQQNPRSQTPNSAIDDVPDASSTEELPDIEIEEE